MTTKFWKPIGSSKLIRHPRWDFFAPVNSTGLGVPPPPSTGRPTITVSVFYPRNASIDPTTQQQIGETCTCRYASTSATGRLANVNSRVMSCVLYFFADDTTVYVQNDSFYWHCDRNPLYRIGQSITVWFDCNKLTLNVNRTQMVMLSPKINLTPQNKVILRNEVV